MKLKKSVKRKLIIGVILITVLIGGFSLVKKYLYKQTYEYKLQEINYTEEDTKILIEKLKDKELDIILEKEHNPNISKLVSEKYFIFKNLDRYLKYLDKNNSYKPDKVIPLVNVNRDRDYYEKPVNINIDGDKLMLVNKYHYLGKDYTPANIVATTGTYSYADNSLNEEAYTAYQELADKAKEAGYTILIISSYRDYEVQEDVWNQRKLLYGTRKADEYAARAGYSEHQTGYAIDVGDYHDANDKFGETESYEWMKENAHHYGFILRYPKDKEDITGYSYEPWHYRFVGKEVAEKIYKEQITFDEYYAYYLEK